MMKAATAATVGVRAAGCVEGLWVPRINFLDGLVFVIPMLRFIQFDLVGRLYFTELLLAGMLPFLFMHRGAHLFKGAPRTVMALLLVWLITQIATDLIVSTPLTDYVRGWSKICFTLVNFWAIYLLIYGKVKRVVLFIGGAALGDLIAYFVSPNLHAATYPWKFGYGPGVTWLLILVALGVGGSRSLGRILPAVILLLGSVANIYMGARGAGGLMFLTFVYVSIQTIRRKSSRSSLDSRQIVIIGGIILLGSWGILQIYEQAVRDGWLGESALQKYEMQASGEYGLLLGGRSEILVSSRAILDSPLIGHGSWAKNCKYVTLYSALKERAGYSAAEEREDCLIPAHSYLMGTWVEAGLLGIIFWIWVLALAVRVLVRWYAVKSRFTPLVIFTVLVVAWDTLFSPFAAWARFMVPFYIVSMMSFLEIFRVAGRK